LKLTEAKIKAAKPRGAVQKLSDGYGLQLWVLPGGAKHWRLAFRLGGKQRLLALGRYDDGAVSLAVAREKAREARALLAQGLDPVQEGQKARARDAERRGQTFAAIADEVLAQKREAGRAAATLDKVTWLLSLARPSLGNRPIREITAADVSSVLQAVVRRGRHESAARLRAVIGEVFRFAVATQRADSDVTLSLRGALAKPKAGHRAAIVEQKKFGELLRAIWGYGGQPETTAALKLMAYLAPRPGELRQAKWPEFNVDGAVWSIPAERAKMRREHVVPLARQAIDVLNELGAIQGINEYVFPAIGGGRKPLSEAAMNSALRRMGFAKDEMSAHGFRSAFSTMANESGRWSADAIERQLAHVGTDTVRNAYHRGAHWEDRVRLMAWWADKVDAIRNGAEVVELKRQHASL
jgi:integrase